MGGFAFHGARDSIDEQRRPSKAVPHSPQPIGLLLCPNALLMTSVTASVATALVIMLSTHPTALMSATEACVKSHAHVFGLRRHSDFQRPNVFA